MQKRVLLIGGGEIKNKETISLDRQFIKKAGDNNAIIGFFPTAANDSQEYIDIFTNYYKNLGCKEIIPIILKNIENQEVNKILERVTGVYFGGGNTSLLISIIRKYKIDRLIQEYLSKGVVIAGMSAGALASCDYFIDPESEVKTLKICKGLGFQHSTICIVHYNLKKDNPTLNYLKKKFTKYKIIGIREKSGLFV